MKLSEFICAHTEEILTEWEAFAKTLLPAAAAMSTSELRDDAQRILQAIALDLETDQTARQQAKKSKGSNPVDEGTAASIHGRLREDKGFTLGQLVAEYRALRASVLRLWQRQPQPATQETVDDLMRFNEAIDQALAESIDEYSELSRRTRETFLAMLGHDLRTPLHSITLGAEYLSGASLHRDGIHRTSLRLKRSAARMTAMIHDLLEYSRVQLGGKMRVVHTSFNFKDLAEAALVDVSAAYPNCPFELETSGDLTAEVDGARVHQMLTNLLSNAAQYRDDIYSVTLSVAGEADEILVNVKNRGAVIPQEFFEAIFNPLVQLKTAAGDSSRPATSLGLGLHIARSVAVAHNGTISVSSTETNGTVFTVRLPRHKVTPTPRRPTAT
jgi:signal transduction histidine kinase